MAGEITSTTLGSKQIPWNKGKLTGREAATPTKTPLGNPDQAAGRWKDARLSNVQPCDRQQVARLRYRCT